MCISFILAHVNRTDHVEAQRQYMHLECTTRQVKGMEASSTEATPYDNINCYKQDLKSIEVDDTRRDASHDISPEIVATHEILHYMLCGTWNCQKPSSVEPYEMRNRRRWMLIMTCTEHARNSDNSTVASLSNAQSARSTDLHERRHHPPTNKNQQAEQARR